MKANIQWSYPILFDNFSTNEKKNDKGIYQITRIFGNNQTLIYVGKAFQQTFEQRLNDHKKDWIDNYKGIIKVRFGEVSIYSNNNKIISRVENHHFENIESAIIYETKPIQNDKKKKGYSYTSVFEIISLGNRGEIPENINMQNHL